jgi:small conductance mechanosensitive channel
MPEQPTLTGLWNDIQPHLAEWGLKVLGAIVIFIVGKWLARLVSQWVAKGLKAQKMDETAASFLSNFTYFALLALVIIAVIKNLGVTDTSFAAVLAAAGLAVGFALQGSLANFAAGVMLMTFRPFNVGAWWTRAACSAR